MESVSIHSRVRLQHGGKKQGALSLARYGETSAVTPSKLLRMRHGLGVSEQTQEEEWKGCECVCVCVCVCVRERERERESHG